MCITLRLLTFSLCITFGHAIGRGQLVSDSSDLEKPLAAIVKSSSWMEVFENDLDLEVTLHYGGSDGAGSLAHYETIQKQRQVYDRSRQVVFTAWAVGATELETKRGSALSDYRERRARIVEDRKIRQVDFLQASEHPRGECSNDCLARSSPLNLLQVVCNETVYSGRFTEQNDRAVFMERLSSLRPDQLHTTREKVNGRMMTVYRIKADPMPKSVAICVTRLVVPESGFDAGLISEIHSSFMRIDDKSKYTSEKNLLKEVGEYSQVIKWKEVSFVSKAGKTRQAVLPVLVEKRREISSIKDSGYFNMSLNWRSFTDDSSSMLSVTACDKLSAKYLDEIDRALGR